MKQKVFKIFLLDNDQGNSPAMVSILERAGYRVKWFVLLSEMEKKFATELPDLFIINPFFDHDEGVKFLYRRKKDEVLARIPVVALGQFQDGYTIAQLQAIGVKDYLAKPTNAKLLLNLCKRILNRDSIKTYYFNDTENVVAQAPLTFIKISETTIQAECPLKLTDEVDGHYRVISKQLESRGIVDEGLFLSRNTTFVSNDGQFRAFFRMRGLREETLQLIRSGRI